MAFGLPLIQEYQDPALAHDLDQLSVDLKDYLHAEHDEDGRHTPYADYTPLWTGTVSNPTKGQLTGRWCRRGRLVTFELHMRAVGNTTFGVETWRFTLPLPVKTPYQTFQAMAIDASAGLALPLSAWAPERGTANPDGTYIYVNTVSGTFVDETTPFTWAEGDSLHVCGSYETVAD